MRLTAREKELADVIRKEPMISQEQLAKRLGITRSSVAVHISNLMKKGIILGKGYVFNEKITCLVAGSTHYLIKVDSQTNQVVEEPSGFGYRLSRSLACLGIDVTLLTILPRDEGGEFLYADLQQQGVNMAHVLRPGEVTTPRIVKVREEARTSCWGVELPAREAASLIESRHWLVENSEYMAVEPRMADIISGLLPQGEKRPYLCTCMGEDEYTEQGWLSEFDLVVIGLKSISKDSLPGEMPSAVRPCGLLAMTDGNNGILIRDREGLREFGFLPGQGFNVETELEGFLAGLIYGMSAGYGLRQAVRIAAGNASVPA